jgi:SRSO17 transposase
MEVRGLMSAPEAVLASAERQGFVARAFTAWAIEDSFETAKNEFGLDHNESRSWHGWHRHVSMTMLAFAMMAAIRHRANPPRPKKTKRRPPAKAKAKPRRH